MEKEKKAKLPKKAELDLTAVTGEEGFVRAMWSAIGMGERVEEDWNALKNTVLAGGRLPRRIEVRGWNRFQKECPQAVKKLWKLLDDYTDRDDHPRCKFVNLEGASDIVLLAPDLLLVGTLPVQALSLYILFYQDSLKMSIIGLVLALLLLAQAFILGCTVSMAQARWHVSRRRKRLMLWRLGLCVLLCAVALGGIFYQTGKAGVSVSMWMAFGAAVLALAGKFLYTVIFLWKTR